MKTRDARGGALPKGFRMSPKMCQAKDWTNLEKLVYFSRAVRETSRMHGPLAQLAERLTLKLDIRSVPRCPPCTAFFRSSMGFLFPTTSPKIPGLNHFREGRIRTNL